ncbi:hypothetical protein DFO68_103173 [Halomonas ventosae]|uniref:Amidohydrolase family protein n=1 Tax=Halomonas ventosae TaxID=229007 RepID=A0A4R6HZ97_9GAMM|nr:hypothetical protein DFO68_103173 [Halomonas ventosae]
MILNDSRVLRAELLSFEADPGEGDAPAEGSPDAALWIENGHIRAVDDHARLTP